MARCACAQALRGPADVRQGVGRRAVRFTFSHRPIQASRAWPTFHNDVRDKRDAFAALIKGMETCKIDLR